MSIQVKSDSVAPHIDAPIELIITGYTFIALQADNNAIFAPGIEPVIPTAIVSPTLIPLAETEVVNDFIFVLLIIITI